MNKYQLGWHDCQRPVDLAIVYEAWANKFEDEVVDDERDRTDDE